MRFRIAYTVGALQDLHKIGTYISDVLQEAGTAIKQVSKLMDAAESLDHMPFRHRRCEHEPWHSAGFCVFPIDNYLIFYLPDESKHVVEVSRIIYGGRNIPAQLEQSE